MSLMTDEVYDDDYDHDVDNDDDHLRKELKIRFPRDVVYLTFN